MTIGPVMLDSMHVGATAVLHVGATMDSNSVQCTDHNIGTGIHKRQA